MPRCRNACFGKRVDERGVDRRALARVAGSRVLHAGPVAHPVSPAMVRRTVSTSADAWRLQGTVELVSKFYTVLDDDNALVVGDIHLPQVLSIGGPTFRPHGGLAGNP